MQTGVSAAATESGVHSTQHSVGSLCVCPGTPAGDLAGGGAGELCHQPEVREGPEGEGEGCESRTDTTPFRCGSIHVCYNNYILHDCRHSENDLLTGIHNGAGEILYKDTHTYNAFTR